MSNNKNKLPLLSLAAIMLASTSNVTFAAADAKVSLTATDKAMIDAEGVFGAEQEKLTKKREAENKAAKEKFEKETKENQFKKNLAKQLAETNIAEVRSGVKAIIPYKDSATTEIVKPLAEIEDALKEDYLLTLFPDNAIISNSGTNFFGVANGERLSHYFTATGMKQKNISAAIDDSEKQLITVPESMRDAVVLKLKAEIDSRLSNISGLSPAEKKSKQVIAECLNEAKTKLDDKKYADDLIKKYLSVAITNTKVASAGVLADTDVLTAKPTFQAIFDGIHTANAFVGKVAATGKVSTENAILSYLTVPADADARLAALEKLEKAGVISADEKAALLLSIPTQADNLDPITNTDTLEAAIRAIADVKNIVESQETRAKAIEEEMIKNLGISSVEQIVEKPETKEEISLKKANAAIEKGREKVAAEFFTDKNEQTANAVNSLTNYAIADANANLDGVLLAKSGENASGDVWLKAGYENASLTYFEDAKIKSNRIKVAAGVDFKVADAALVGMAVHYNMGDATNDYVSKNEGLIKLLFPEVKEEADLKKLELNSFTSTIASIYGKIDGAGSAEGFSFIPVVNVGRAVYAPAYTSKFYEEKNKKIEELQKSYDEYKKTIDAITDAKKLEKEIVYDGKTITTAMSKEDALKALGARPEKMDLYRNLFDASLKVAYGFDAGSDVIVTPYAGLGYTAINKSASGWDITAPFSKGDEEINKYAFESKVNLLTGLSVSAGSFPISESFSLSPEMSVGIRYGISLNAKAEEKKDGDKKDGDKKNGDKKDEKKADDKVIEILAEDIANLSTDHQKIAKAFNKAMKGSEGGKANDYGVNVKFALSLKSLDLSQAYGVGADLGYSNSSVSYGGFIQLKASF